MYFEKRTRKLDVYERELKKKHIKFSWKASGRRQVGRPISRWQEDIKIGITEITAQGLQSTASCYDPVMAYIEQVNTTSGVKKPGSFWSGEQQLTFQERSSNTERFAYFVTYLPIRNFIQYLQA
jgi:hypothetical protein